jgi:adsorption protein B
MVGSGAIGLLDACARELALFAGVGFLIGGLDDLAVDLLWIGRSFWRRLFVYRRHARATAATLAAPVQPGRIALFVPAWHEAAVIGGMIEAARARLPHMDWRLYLGTYPNDPATAEAAQAAAAGDPRIRIVVGDAPGPTTKAGCLNWLWQALLEDEAAEGLRVKAVVLHDAEDIVHADELRLYDSLVERLELVQIPVRAEVVRGHGVMAMLMSGHYCGEFAEAHGKQVVVREAVGAAVPSAGVGTAIAREALGRLATAARGPFDPGSLTEDYELGLKVAATGGRSAFVRLPASDGSGLVAVHACFPHSFGAAVRQKARWMTGIALAGWDRLGWQGGPAEHWMRLRDRRALLAALVLAAAYLALLGWGVEGTAALITGTPATIALPGTLILANLGLLAWRMAMRAGFTAAAHGWRMALLTPIHMMIGNIVAMAASVRALGLYLGLIRHGRLRWDKTVHVLPAMVAR